MKEILEYKAVSKSYENSEFSAVSNINFKLKESEFVSIVGESGCGKTTFLRLAAGLEIPSSGSIVLNGKTVAGDDTWVPAEKRGIGMVFQGGALFPHLTAADNIAYGIHAIPKKDVHEKVHEMLELVGLPDYCRRYPHELSGGECQRVALARALAPEPKLVLLDEPFSNLNRSLRFSLRGEVQRILKKVNASSIFVTHDIEDASSLSDRIIILRKGHVIQSGNANDVVSTPNCEYCSQIVNRAT